MKDPYLTIAIIEGIALIALVFIAWAINYDKNEQRLTFKKKEREFDEGWSERTNQLLDAQRLLAEEMNRHELTLKVLDEAKKAYSTHNERVNAINAELNKVTSELEELKKANEEVEKAYDKARRTISSLGKIITRRETTIEKLKFKLQHPRKRNGEFAPKHSKTEQDND